MLAVKSAKTEFNKVSASYDIVFEALANPKRRALFERLSRDGEQPVHVLTEMAGVSRQAVSKHLRVLKLARLVHDRPEGKTTHYSARREGTASLTDWLNAYGVFPRATRESGSAGPLNRRA